MICCERLQAIFTLLWPALLLRLWITFDTCPVIEITFLLVGLVVRCLLVLLGFYLLNKLRSFGLNRSQNSLLNSIVLAVTHLAVALLDVCPTFNLIQEGALLAIPLVRVFILYNFFFDLVVTVARITKENVVFGQDLSRMLSIFLLDFLVRRAVLRRSFG